MTVVGKSLITVIKIVFLIFLLHDLIVSKIKMSKYNKLVYIKVLFLAGCCLCISYLEAKVLMDRFGKLQLTTVININITGFLLFLGGISLIEKKYAIRHYENRYKVYRVILKHHQNYYDKLVGKNLDTRKFRHDITNHLYCLGELYRTGKFEEFEQYFGDIQTKAKKLKLQETTGMYVADIIINYLMEQKENKGTHLHWSGMLPANMEIADIDMASIISNLLRNAFKAVKNNNKNARHIYLVVKEVEGSLYIKIKNPVVKKVEIKDGNLSLLPKNQGLGSMIVKEILQKYGGSIRYQSTDTEFIVEVVILNVFGM